MGLQLPVLLAAKAQQERLALGLLQWTLSLHVLRRSSQSLAVLKGLIYFRKANAGMTPTAGGFGGFVESIFNNCSAEKTRENIKRGTSPFISSQIGSNIVYLASNSFERESYLGGRGLFRLFCSALCRIGPACTPLTFNWRCIIYILYLAATFTLWRFSFCCRRIKCCVETYILNTNIKKKKKTVFVTDTTKSI